MESEIPIPPARPSKAMKSHERPGAGERLLSAIGPLLAALTFVGLAWWSWGRWCDVQVDYGRELYVPWRIAEGEVLYRDLAWFNGPLSPYLGALCFALFGTGFWTLAWANLAILALCGLALFALLKAAFDRAAALAGVLTLFAIFGFGHLVGIGNYNWICPYSHEMTHGVFLSIAALLAAGQVGRGRGIAWLAAAGFLLGLVFLTKAEVFAAAAAGTGVGLALSLGAHSAPRATWLRGLALFAGAALVPPIAAWILLATAMPAGDALIGVLGSWPGVLFSEASELDFYRRGMGLDDPGRRLGILLAWSGRIALVLAVLAGLDLALRRGGRWRAAVAAAAALGGASLAFAEVEWLRTATPLPLLMLAAGLAAALGWRPAGSAAERGACALRISLSVLALALLFKIVLDARVHHYGFALAMPAGALLAAALASWIPAGLRRLGGSGQVFRWGAAGLGLAAALGFGRVSNDFYHERQVPLAVEGRQRVVHGKSIPIGEDPDRFWTDARGLILKPALLAIEQIFEPEDTLLVLPEGVMLNYLSRRRTPTRFVNFMPPELILFGEDAMIAELEADPPEGVILLHKSTREYGFEFFGRDYGRDLFAWIGERYRPLGPPIGQPPLEPGTIFGLQVLVRRR